ncbi:MAG: FliH/SctL family protein [Bacillota bacterium]|nr:FliH/SctL family protein [Bacillota bacterium]
MFRASTTLIKRHVAALVGSRQVVSLPPAEVTLPAEEAGESWGDGTGPRIDVTSGPDAQGSTLETRVGVPASADNGAAIAVPGSGDGEVPAEVAAMLEAVRAEAGRLEREVRERAEREGWEAGFAAGQEEGRALARRETEETLHGVLALLEDARRERLVILRQAQQDAVRMALDLAARILEREVSLSPEVVREQAAALLGRFEHGEKATLHVHPDDVAVMQPWLPELAGACGASLDAVADPAVGRGGVMVETEHGYLDGRLDRQLRRLGEALLNWTGSLPDPGEEEEGREGDGREHPDAGGDGNGQDAG